MSAVKGVRMGKLIEMDIDAPNEEDARNIAVGSCEKLLANMVMENYHIEIKKA
jgi:phosphoribosylformylglycinamidine synthase